MAPPPPRTPPPSLVADATSPHEAAAPPSPLPLPPRPLPPPPAARHTFCGGAQPQPPAARHTLRGGTAATSDAVAAATAAATAAANATAPRPASQPPCLSNCRDRRACHNCRDRRDRLWRPYERRGRARGGGEWRGERALGRRNPRGGERQTPCKCLHSALESACTATAWQVGERERGDAPALPPRGHLGAAGGGEGRRRGPVGTCRKARLRDGHGPPGT